MTGEAFGRIPVFTKGSAMFGRKPKPGSQLRHKPRELSEEAIASGHPGAPLEWSLGGLLTVPEWVQLPELLNSEKW